MSRGYLMRVPQHAVEQLLESAIPPIFAPVVTAYLKNVARCSPESGGYLTWTALPDAAYHVMARRDDSHVIFGFELINDLSFREDEIHKERKLATNLGGQFVTLEPGEGALRQMHNMYLRY